MNKILLVEFKDKSDDKNNRYILDIAKGVVYKDDHGFQGRLPIRWTNNKMWYWYETDDNKEWKIMRDEFSETYKKYLRILKLAQNAEIDDALEAAVLGDNEE